MACRLRIACGGDSGQVAGDVALAAKWHPGSRAHPALHAPGGHASGEVEPWPHVIVLGRTLGPCVWQQLQAWRTTFGGTQT